MSAFKIDLIYLLETFNALPPNGQNFLSLLCLAIIKLLIMANF